MHIFSDSVKYKYTPGVCVCVHSLTMWHTNDTFICMSNDFSYIIYFDSSIQTTFVGVCVKRGRGQVVFFRM